MTEKWKVPDVIYLQGNAYVGDGWCPDITWCVDQINDTDTQYLRSTPERRTTYPALLAENERLRAVLERQRQGLVNLLEVGALPTHWDDPVHDEIAAIDAALAKGDTDA